MLFGMRLLSAMGVTLILPVMPTMARTFGQSIAETGMVVVCFSLTETCMAPCGVILLLLLTARRLWILGMEENPGSAGVVFQHDEVGEASLAVIFVP